jgi:hypothetical protein
MYRLDPVSTAAVVRVIGENRDGLAVPSREFLAPWAELLRDPIEARGNAGAETLGHATR